jgi:putative N6-adenine-specific DNA methylase
MIMVALCAGGTERLVSNEIRKLSTETGRGFRIMDSGFGNVRFETDLTGIYYALLSLRAADRLLLEAADFDATDFDALFEGVRAVAWEDYIPKGMGLVVDKARSNHSRLAAETSIQAVAHKAAAERLCARYGQNSLPDEKTGVLRVHIEKDRARIMLDLCGAPLFKRGYRLEGGIAPLRESMAAALVLQSLWRRKYPLYDPFCGSGTIVIEAALFAWNAAPGLWRQFAISNLAIADSGAEAGARRDLLERIDTSRTVLIFGSDGDSAVAGTAKANLERALGIMGGPRPCCLPKLWFRKMEEAKAPADEGFIITNPPYGMRLLDKENAEALYRNMAVLRKNFPAWKMNVLSAHAGFETFLGEKAARCKKFTSGAVETYFYEYDGKGRRNEHEKAPSRVRDKPDPSAAHDSFGTKTKRHGKELTYTW